MDHAQGPGHHRRGPGRRCAGGGPSSSSKGCTPSGKIGRSDERGFVRPSAARSDVDAWTARGSASVRSALEPPGQLRRSCDGVSCARSYYPLPYRRDSGTTSTSRTCSRRCPTSCCRAASETRAATGIGAGMEALEEAILEALTRRGLALAKRSSTSSWPTATRWSASCRRSSSGWCVRATSRPWRTSPSTTPRRAGAAWARPEPPVQFELTDKGIDFLGYQDAEGPAGLARQVLLRAPRHPRPGHRRRSLRRVEALRVRRHAQPRRQRHAVLGHPARGPASRRSTSTTPTCRSTRASTSPPAPPC